MTWTRKALKDSAKDVLRTNYWTAFVVSLVLAFVADNGSSGGSPSSDGYFESSTELIESYLPIILSVVLVLIVLKIFAFYNLEAGGRRFFIRAAEGESNIGYLGSCFGEGSYFPIIKTLLLRDIYIFLWSLLLIIPGIVKSYAYRFVPYILADNPNIGVKRAIELSNEMTYGHKWDMFILDLSFIGWYLLGLLVFFIGIFFVKPYENATMAELYLILKRNGLETEMVTYEELNMSEII